MQAGGRCCKRMDLLCAWPCTSSFFGCVRLGFKANAQNADLAECKTLETHSLSGEFPGCARKSATSDLRRVRADSCGASSLSSGCKPHAFASGPAAVLKKPSTGLRTSAGATGLGTLAAQRHKP